MILIAFSSYADYYPFGMKMPGKFGGGYFGPMIGDEGIKPVANYILDNVDVYANGSN